MAESRFWGFRVSGQRFRILGRGFGVRLKAVTCLGFMFLDVAVAQRRPTNLSIPNRTALKSEKRSCKNSLTYTILKP